MLSKVFWLATISINSHGREEQLVKVWEVIISILQIVHFLRPSYCKIKFTCFVSFILHYNLLTYSPIIKYMT